MSFAHAIDDRYFEDYVEGSVHDCGSIAVEANEVVAFANRFDPQSIHTDPEAAKRGPFGGVIASGWHTCGLMMRLYVEHYLTHVASLASPGLDELRWLEPVRPGDRLSLRVTVLKATPSKSKPDRGAVISFVEVLNQTGVAVMTFRVVNIIARRRAA
jgi:acyl dehydratase